MTTDFPTAPPAYGLNGPSATVTVEKSPHASHTEILTTPLLLEQNDEWALQRRYMTLETLAEVGDNPTVSLSAVTV